MKIPVYQPRVGYEKAYARNVALAQPTLQSVGKSKWSDIADAGDVMTGLYQLPFALKRTGQVYQASARALEQALGQETAARPAVSQITQTAAPETSFSAPQRREQLAFARSQAWQPAADKTAGAASSAVEKLDENFAGILASSGFGGANEDLLAQDYVILRREMQYLQDKEVRRQQQENLLEGAGAFVQTAAMIRTPKALESYIAHNLAAAQAEARQNGLPESSREQINALYGQAVGHNIQAALQAGETGQAQAVFAHFSNRLSPQENALLARKITARQADQSGESLWPAARQYCTQEDGTLNEEKLNAFVQQHSADKDEVFRRDLQQALQARLQAQQHKDLRRQAQSYRRLAQAAGGTQDIAALMEEDGFGVPDFEQNQQALRLYQTQPQKTSLPQTFNRLQNLIWQGENPQKEIAQALQKGELNAADYWRLKARSASAQADGTDVRQALLGAAVKQFCQNQHLAQQTAEQIAHFVFSSGEDWQQQLEAARMVRRIFQLQESN